jgi:positive phototaxis protein PixI
METTSSLAIKLQELLPSLFESNQVAGTAYLRFELTPEISALFSMEHVQEALLVPAESITLVPNMPAIVMGLMSSRDRVFEVVDLAQLAGFAPLSTYLRQHHVIVLRIASALLDRETEAHELRLAIAVHKIQGVIRSVSAQGRSAAIDFPPNLIPFGDGCIVASDSELLVLDPKAIINRALAER